MDARPRPTSPAIIKIGNANQLISSNWEDVATLGFSKGTAPFFRLMPNIDVAAYRQWTIKKTIPAQRVDFDCDGFDDRFLSIQINFHLSQILP